MFNESIDLHLNYWVNFLLYFFIDDNFNSLQNSPLAKCLSCKKCLCFHYSLMIHSEKQTKYKQFNCGKIDINPADITRMLQMRHFFLKKDHNKSKKCCTFGFVWYCYACCWQKYIGLAHDIHVRRRALKCVCVVNTQKLPLPNLSKCFFLNSFFSMQNFLECAKTSFMLSSAILQSWYIWAKEIFYIWWCNANIKRTKASDQATQTVNKSCLPM